ncbi:hypothetical protein TNCV_462531 [Trichonephila clavipes]|nr:hypothetical protein TNCV_462531 [Trichonephila clavipes]
MTPFCSVIHLMAKFKHNKSKTNSAISIANNREIVCAFITKLNSIDSIPILKEKKWRQNAVIIRDGRSREIFPKPEVAGVWYTELSDVVKNITTFISDYNQFMTNKG